MGVVSITQCCVVLCVGRSGPGNCVGVCRPTDVLSANALVYEGLESC